MKMFRPLLFHLLLYCVTQTLGVKIQSVPGGNSDGVVQTELDMTVSLVCQTDGDHETQADEELVWLRNGAAVVLQEENKRGRSSVCVTPVVLEDNGATFTCRLKKNDSSTASVTLNVTYHPQLSGSEEVTVEEEAVMVLQCDIKANPSISSVSWTLNGRNVDLFASGFSLTIDGYTSRLTTNSVERSLHEGTYKCTAEAPGYVGHKLFHVTVIAKTMKFPLFPMIAGLVVVGLTAVLAVASRWNKIAKCLCSK